MTVCRGLRGATRSEANTEEDIYGATREMLQQLIEANGIVEKDVAMAYFTVTPDLNAAFPAAAARQLGWNNTALMCATEIAVPNSLPSCIRVLILINTDKEPDELSNIYLKGTEILRLSGVVTT
ncbi:MAG: chorismate mutase [Chloroflexota bacterium]|nr:chorismate mutase [Chloroflexota bacterium]